MADGNLAADGHEEGRLPLAAAIQEVRRLVIETSDTSLQLHRRHAAALAQLRKEMDQIRRRFRRLSTAG